MQGFIKLHRKIKDHWLYLEKRKFSRYEAWIDLLMMASHKENKFVHGNELLEVKRGQFITSIRKLGDRWCWSNTKVSSFLDLLKSDGMIDYKKDTKKTVVTIVNYGIYHGDEKEKKTHVEHEPNTKTYNQEGIKNVKEDNIPYSEIVNYLNEKANKNFKSSSKKTRELIKVRWNEGHRLEDFKKVIDICVGKWSGTTFNNGVEGETYLQPSTLFNNKFDERLNWTSQGQKKQPVDHRDKEILFQQWVAAGNNPEEFNWTTK